jgi:hypothetical protein
MAYGEPDPRSGTALAVFFVCFDGRSLSRWLKMLKIWFFTWAVRPKPKPVFLKKFFTITWARALAGAVILKNNFLFCSYVGSLGITLQRVNTTAFPFSYGSTDSGS